MKILSLFAIVLVAGGCLLLVDGGIRLWTCLERGTFSPYAWTNEFWLLVPGVPGAGLGPNAKWFIRLLPGVIVTAFGYLLFRLSNRL